MKLRRCQGPDPDTHTYDCGDRIRGEIRMKQTKFMRSSVTAKQRRSYSLFIEGTTTAGGGAVFKEGLSQVLVEVVRH